VTGEALATLVVNKLRGVLNVVAIKAPGFGERRKALLQDIAIITGGEYIATDLGLSVETAELESLGSARRVSACCSSLLALTIRDDCRAEASMALLCTCICAPPTRACQCLWLHPPAHKAHVDMGLMTQIVVANNKTTLIADAGSKEDIQARVAQIKRELENSDSIYDQQKLSERIAKLSGGVAIIKVGASTETELEDRKLRIEDAKNATFAAVEEGIVPGGGAAFAHLAVEVQAIADAMPDPEEQLGALILQKAIVAPCRLISFNSGSEGDVIVQKTQEAEWKMGYNAMTDTFEDLMAAGVIDPKKVTRSALQNAVSVAGMVLTTQAIVTDVPKKPVAAGAAGAGPADQDGMMSI
jgi:chaperonin GroEL (HSP60 family)